MITEYTSQEFKGLNLDGKTSYHYWVIKLGDNLYYKTHDEDKIQTTTDISAANHITNERAALELLAFLDYYFDSNGHKRPENSGRIIPPLVGLAEAPEILGWDKRKVSTYIKRGLFPKPLTRLASGPVWTYKQIENYGNIGINKLKCPCFI